MKSKAVIWAVAIIVVVIGIVVGLVYFRPISLTALCGGHASFACLQGWLSALSGWAALIAAGLTVWFIYKQTSAIAEQASEIRAQTNQLRRQVDFALGAMKPTLSIQRVSPEGERFVVVLELKNMNQHQIRVDGFSSSPDVEIISSEARLRDLDPNKNYTPKGSVRYAGISLIGYRVAGRDPNDILSTRQLKLKLQLVNPDVEKDNPRLFIALHITILGPEHWHEVISATCSLKMPDEGNVAPDNPDREG